MGPRGRDQLFVAFPPDPVDTEDLVVGLGRSSAIVLHVDEALLPESGGDLHGPDQRSAGVASSVSIQRDDVSSL